MPGSVCSAEHLFFAVSVPSTWQAPSWLPAAWKVSVFILSSHYVVLSCSHFPGEEWRLSQPILSKALMTATATVDQGLDTTGIAQKSAARFVVWKLDSKLIAEKLDTEKCKASEGKTELDTGLLLQPHFQTPEPCSLQHCLEKWWLS